MNIPDIIIAIDGYSSTGKSSFAKLLAKKIGFLYLDSGALYRGVTLFAQEERLINRLNTVSPMLREALKDLMLSFGPRADAACCTSCGTCMSKCPQGVKIVDELQNIVTLVERVKKGGRG